MYRRVISAPYRRHALPSILPTLQATTRVRLQCRCHTFIEILELELREKQKTLILFRLSFGAMDGT